MRKHLFLLLLSALAIRPAIASSTEETTETARETWWYFSKKLVSAPAGTGFAVKLADNYWHTIHRAGNQGSFLATRTFYEKGQPYTDSTFADSARILDWAFNDHGIIRGAFSVSTKEAGARKALALLLNATFGNEVVGDDFVALSKWSAVKEMNEDTFALHFFQTRYKGGLDGFYRYLGSSLSYPVFAREFGLQGYCYAEFVVQPDGTVTGVTVKQSIGGGTKKEVHNVISNIPGFMPVDASEKIKFTLPVKFLLQ